MKQVLIFGMFVVSVFLARETALMADGVTHLSFFAIGQGDSAMITTKTGEHIVVDGGRDLSPLEELAKHMPYFDRTIDLLVLSHPNEDHLASFLQILRRYNVRAALIAPVDYDLPRYAGILALLEASDIPVIEARAGKRIEISNLVLDIVWPELGFSASDVNDLSIVMRIHDGTHSALLTGDMEERAERALLQTPVQLRSELLKVAHHGSRTSTSTGFLLAVRPHQSVISVGKNNQYGHPSEDIINRLESHGSAVWRTDTSGTLDIVWE